MDQFDIPNRGRFDARPTGGGKVIISSYTDAIFPPTQIVAFHITPFLAHFNTLGCFSRDDRAGEVLHG